MTMLVVIMSITTTIRITGENGMKVLTRYLAEMTLMSAPAARLQ